MFKTKPLIFSAMAIALATVLSHLKIADLPSGGSITLFSMMIICLIGYWYGPIMGLTTAVAYGFLQLMINPYAIHPLQVILDYPLSFGALGLSGFFHKKKKGLIPGYLTGVAGRFVFATISGLIFFTAYVGNAAEDWSAIHASILYNLSYLAPEAILTVLLLCIEPVRAALENVRIMTLKD